MQLNAFFLLLLLASLLILEKQESYEDRISRLDREAYAQCLIFTID